MFQDHVNIWFASIWVHLVLGALAYIAIAVLLFIFVGPYLHEPSKYDDKGTLGMWAAGWPVVSAFFLGVGVITGTCWCIYQIFKRPITWINNKFESKSSELQKARYEAAELERQRSHERRQAELQAEYEKQEAEEEARKEAQEKQGSAFRNTPSDPKPCPTCGMKPFEPTPQEATEVRAPGNEYI